MEVYKRYPIFITYIIFILLFSLLSGCENNQVVEGKPEKIKLGVSMASMKEDVFTIMKEAMYDSSKRDNVEIIWKDAQNDEGKQTADIENLIKENIDILIINPVNSETAGKLVNKVKEKNIPVIALDRLVNNVYLDGYVTANSFRTGIEQAKYLADQLDHEGKIIILKGDKNTNVAYEITEGNKAVLIKEPKIKIVMESWHKNWSADQAENTVRIALEKFPDIKGILANNSSMAMAAVKVLKEKKLNDKVVTVGADASKEASQAIAQGELNADVDKMPYLLGLTSFKIATMIARNQQWLYNQIIKNGDFKTPTYITPVQLINRYNLVNMENRWGPLLEK